MNTSFSPLGDQAIVIELGTEINEETEKKIRRLSTLLESRPPNWMIEFIPAFITVAVFYDPCAATYSKVQEELAELLAHLGEELAVESRTVEIPVC